MVVVEGPLVDVSVPVLEVQARECVDQVDGPAVVDSVIVSDPECRLGSEEHSIALYKVLRDGVDPGIEASPELRMATEYSALSVSRRRD